MNVLFARVLSQSSWHAIKDPSLTTVYSHPWFWVQVLLVEGNLCTERVSSLEFFSQAYKCSLRPLGSAKDFSLKNREKSASSNIPIILTKDAEEMTVDQNDYKCKNMVSFLRKWMPNVVEEVSQLSLLNIESAKRSRNKLHGKRRRHLTLKGQCLHNKETWGSVSSQLNTVSYLTRRITWIMEQVNMVKTRK